MLLPITLSYVEWLTLCLAVEVTWISEKPQPHFMGGSMFECVAFAGSTLIAIIGTASRAPSPISLIFFNFPPIDELHFDTQVAYRSNMASIANSGHCGITNRSRSTVM